MSDEIKHQWRVTKYNPSNRDEYGYYKLEEWTCPSEIGKTINGKVFTYNEYLQAEDAYVNTAMNFIEESGVTTTRILLLSTIWLDKDSNLYDSEFDQLELKEDRLVSLSEIKLICKMVLRRLLDCQLYDRDKFFLHFGWDYYMYIGSYVNCLSAVQCAKENGLYPEEMRSPYYDTEEQITRFLEWSDLSKEDNLVVGEEELVGIPLDSLRKMFHLSSYHPVIGAFKLTAEQREFFQPYITHKMDFTKYAYSIWGGS